MTHTVSLPILSVGPGVAAEPAEERQPPLVDNALLCEQWASQTPQGRASMTIDPLLMMYAVWAVSDILTHKDSWGHLKSTGEGPNDAMRRMGIRLPDYYLSGPEANHCESLAFNVPRAEMCVARLLTSPPHKAHMLAEYPTYADQILIGAAWGVNYQRQEGFWWTVGVFVSAPVMQ